MLAFSSKAIIEEWPVLEQHIHNQKGRISDLEQWIKTGMISKSSVLAWIGKQYNIETIDLSIWNPPQEWQPIFIELLERYNVFPIQFSNDSITLASHDPYDLTIKNEIALITNKKVYFCFAFLQDIKWAIEQYKNINDQANRAVQETAKKSENSVLHNSGAQPGEIVQTLLSQAIGQQVSDIHVEPKEFDLLIRYRKDGALVNHTRISKEYHSFLISQLKVMAQMDIAEKRLPQDGRFKYQYQNRGIDIRVSTLPAFYGEKIVLRILDQHGKSFSLDQLGFDEEFITNWSRITKSPHGLILVTGPTGSGKTTTLYTTLQEMESTEKNIVTLEDPIEYALPFANQVQVNSKIGLNFSSGLRSLLRQDPDIMLIGEIRDLETAQFTMQASLTGHFVLSTLHTNSPEGAVVRLKDMGIPSYLIASSLLGVLSQRLLRKICQHCKTVSKDKLDYKMVSQKLNSPVNGIVKANGCEYCNYTGYKGRTVLYEWLPVNNHVKELILQESSEKKMREFIGTKGMQMQILNLLQNQVTSVEEVIRTVGLEGDL